MLSCRGGGRARDYTTGRECPRRHGPQLQGRWRGVSSNVLWSQSSGGARIRAGLSGTAKGKLAIETIAPTPNFQIERHGNQIPKCQMPTLMFNFLHKGTQVSK